ncbi:MAG: TrkH family potassium uptake protein [Bacteroidales bacterium]
MNKARISNINMPIVLRMIGWLLLIEAAFMLVPLVVSLIYADGSTFPFTYAIAITTIVGASLVFGLKPKDDNMGRKEAILLTASIWAVFSLFGTIPFMLSELRLSFTDAYFEAMSGFSTTGASIIRDVEIAPKGILIWRSLTQWVGGMGIILFTLAVVPMLNHKRGIQLFNAEVTGITHDKLRPRISQTAKGLWLVYIVLTVVLAILLYLGPMNLFDAICQTLSTVATGGFSTRNASYMAWDSRYADTVTMIVMFICGINFALLYKTALGDIKPLIKNDTFRLYIAITVIAAVIMIINNMCNGIYESFSDNLIFSFFEVISCMTTTGYGAANFEAWGKLPITIFFILMFFGSCAGSTAGGAKMDRLIYLFKNVKNELYRILHPNAVMPIRINGKVMPSEAITKVMAFLCIYLIILLTLSTVLTALGLPIFDAFFAALSAVSNVGFGAGFTGVDGSFANIPDLGKWLLAFAMLVGRLEVFTVLVVLSKGFWRK